MTPPWLWWTLGSVWFSSSILSPFLVAASPPAGLALFLTPVALTAASAVGIRRRQKRSPLTYTRTEVALVRRHTTAVSLTVPIGAKLQDGEAIQVVAATILATIESSPAWQSPHCDLDRIQLDLSEEVFQIRRSCENLAKLRNLIIEATPSASATSPARAALNDKVSEYRSLYREARAAVIARVAALYTYRQHLTEIEVLLSDLAKASALAAHTDDFSEVFSAIVRDTAAAGRTKALSEDLKILQEQLQDELAFISGTVINDPELVTPLAVLPDIS
jgi:hypothetical protein